VIYRRAIAKLRAQDWFAIAIELAIVVVGVFIGNWVNDRNQQRVQRHEVEGLVDRLKPTLKSLDHQVVGDLIYYANARNYALTAFAGWKRDPRVSDRQFVIAAYQASQVTGFGANTQIFSTLIGADQVREISDPALRAQMGLVLGADFSQLSYQNTLTDYRRHVRELIPNSIQDQVRAQCGDQNTPTGAIVLPPKCDIALPAGEVAMTAATLRAHPELVNELDYHLSQASTQVANIRRFGERAKRLNAMIDEKRR
jgi:hypothetical protein